MLGLLGASFAAQSLLAALRIDDRDQADDAAVAALPVPGEERKGRETLMQVKRFSEAKTYDAPNHRGCAPLRLFGAEAGGTRNLIVGVSHFLPGGGAGPDASPPEC